MRRSISSILLIGLSSISIMAQSIAIKGSDEEPQIAFHLFSNWADNYEADAKKGKAIASSVLFGLGSTALAGAAATWYAGDMVSREWTGSSMDPELKQGLVMGLGIGGAALLVGGIIASTAPIKDYRSIYSDVFQEKDPEVREAMAVSVLRYQADRGKERRITSFISSFVVPIIVGGIKAGVNVSQGDPWDKDVLKSIGQQSWSMASGIVQLFSKSPEERLYERYVNARDALRYGD